MGYPQPSTALDSHPRSFWFVRRIGGVQNVCTTRGYGLLMSLQAALRTLLVDSGPLPSFGGPISGQDIPSIDTPINREDGSVLPQSTQGWDVATLRGLYAIAQSYSVSRQALAHVEADSRLTPGQSLSPQTVQLAVWVVSNQATRDVARPDGTIATVTTVYGTPSDISFATNPSTTYPLFGVMPPAPSEGRSTEADQVITCAPNAAAIRTETPITVTSSFVPNAWLIVAVLAAAAIGTAIVTKKAPRIVQIRERASR